MKKTLRICSAALLILLTILLGTGAISEEGKKQFDIFDVFSIVPSEQSVTLKPGESVTIKMELRGTFPESEEKTISANMGARGVFNIKWEKVYTEGGKTYAPIVITAVDYGATTLTVYVTGRKEYSATISVEVISDKQTIKFMDMDWYITIEEFEEAMTKQGIKYKESSTSSGAKFDDIWRTFLGDYIYDTEGKGSDKIEFVYYENSYESVNLAPLTKVAGYKVSYIKAKFAPTELKSYSGDPYRLMSAEYTIYGSSNDCAGSDIYSDLENKLLQLYGPKTRENEDKYASKDSIWIAEDKTAVRITLNSRGTAVTVEYGVTDDDEYFAQLFEKARQQQQKKQKEKVEENTENYDGL